MMNAEELIKDAMESNASHAAILDTSKVAFHEDFRRACEKNFCGKYNTSWMGPPAIGPIQDLIRRATRYRSGLLFQTVHPLSSNFDIKGMEAGTRMHEAIFRALLAKIRQKNPDVDLLPLSAGCCRMCEKCAYLQSEPCRHPDQSVSSVEAYGINVIALQKSAGIPYYHGKNNICYVGLILFEKQS
jgi:predicted metal-binding protein